MDLTEEGNLEDDAAVEEDEDEGSLEFEYQDEQEVHAY